jgi:hypothetical protein
MEVSDQLHAPAPLPPGERTAGTRWVGGWVGPRAYLDAVKKRKSLSPAANRTPAVQPVARRCTDWVVWPAQVFGIRKTRYRPDRDVRGWSFSGSSHGKRARDHRSAIGTGRGYRPLRMRSKRAYCSLPHEGSVIERGMLMTNMNTFLT